MFFLCIVSDVCKTVKALEIIIIIIMMMMMMMIMTIIIIIIITIILIIGKGKINSLKPISPQSLNNAKFPLFIIKRIFCLDKPEDENI